MSFFSQAHPLSGINWSNRPSTSIDFSEVQIRMALQSIKNYPIEPYYPLEVLHPIEYYARVHFNRYVRKGKIIVDLFGDMTAVNRLWLWCYQQARHKYEQEIAIRFGR